MPAPPEPRRGAVPPEGPVGAPVDSGLIVAERARIQRRTLLVLAGSQVVGGIGIGVAFAIGTLAARDLSGSDALSGSSVTAMTFGAALAAILLARRAGAKGRRPALSLGWGVAAGGAAVALIAIWFGWFALLLVGFLVMGAATAANLQARFAAADLALPQARGRSLAAIVWATTVGSIAGPNLAQPMVDLATALGAPGMVGPFALSVLGFLAAGVILLIWLRPDPLRAAQALRLADLPAAGPERALSGASLSGGWAAIRGSGQARVALLVLLVGQAVMVAVMAMTPLHLVSHGASLQVVGVTISLHVLGMYALAPVFGWLADTWGPRPVMLCSAGVLLAAVSIAGTAGASDQRVVLGLILLGLGWSAGMVAGSAALVGAVPLAARTAAQGLADSGTSLAGALAAAASGLVLAAGGYGGLNLVAGLLLVPTVVVVLRWRPVATGVGSA